MELKEKIITIDMAVSIFAILLIGIFLGQSFDLTKTGVPALGVFLVFFVLSFIIVVAYLMFQYTIRRAYGNDILKPECGCEHKKAIRVLYNWAQHECEMSMGNQLTSRKDTYCNVAREIKKFLSGEE